MSGRRRSAGAAPEIAREWHPTRNGDRRPGKLYKHSLVRVWWQCAVDPLHAWENTIAARVKQGTGCPYCGGRAAGPNTRLPALKKSAVLSLLLQMDKIDIAQLKEAHEKS